MQDLQKTSSSALRQVNVRSREDIETLASVLRPFIPQSLPVLGALFSGDVENDTLRVWTSFPLTPPPPPLFSVIVQMTLTQGEFRYFCSAEANDDDAPGQLERDHVLSTFRALRRALPSDTIRQPDGTIVFGTINDIWFPVLKPHSTFKYSAIKFIRPPLPIDTQSNWDDSPHPDWVITELCEEDIDLVLQRSLVPRSREYVLARIPYSVCLRTSDTLAPVAWNLLTSDGSTGLLQVVPEYRGRGLSRFVKAALFRKLEQMYYTEDEGKKKLYPHARWESCNIYPDNYKSINLTSSLKGWEKGWLTHWLYI